MRTISIEVMDDQNGHPTSELKEKRQDNTFSDTKFKPMFWNLRKSHYSCTIPTFTILKLNKMSISEVNV